MKMVRKYLNILGLFLSLSIFAQEPGMKNFTYEDGLPSNEVYQSLIDSRGYLWLATNNGVCYFDGIKFTSLDMGDGLFENTIFGMTEDRFGRIWFTGLSGKLSYYLAGEIYQYNKNKLLEQVKKETELIVPGSLTVYDTNDISLLYSSGKYVRIIEDSLVIKSTRKGDFIPISNLQQPNQFFLSKVSNDKNIDIEFLVIFNDSSQINYKAQVDKPWADVINKFLLVEYEDKVIYFIKNKCFIFYRTGQVKELDLAYTPTFSLRSVESGIWIGTKKQGVLFYDDFCFDREPKIQFLENHYITSLQYDQNTRGWVTTLNSGVFNVQALSITNYLNSYYRKRNNIVKLLNLDSNRLLAFSDKGKIFLLKNKKQLKEFDIDELKNERIYQVKKYGDHIYIASSYHFFNIDLKYFTSVKNPFNNVRYVRAGIKDFVIQDSILWLATSSGLFYDTAFLKSDRLNLNLINPQIRSRVNRIIAFRSSDLEDSYSYLMYQDLSSIRRIRYKTNHLDQIESSVFEQNKEKTIPYAKDILIWKDQFVIGTNGKGVFWNNSDSLINYSTKNGLSSNIINKLYGLNDTTLIIATNNGINYLHFNPKNPIELDSVSYISQQDGMAGNEVNDFIVFENYILCATNNGLSLINPKSILKLDDHYKIYISAFKVNDKNILNTNKDEYQLNSHENNISISFEALDFHDRKNITYYYRLYDNKNTSWKQVKEPQINYPLMNAGDYLFQVKAINSYGYESENIAEINFSIAKIFYQTWFFRIGLLIVIVSLLYTLLSYFFNKRNQLLRTEKLLAEYQQQSLTRLINPHFLMNVFNAISSNLFNKNPGAVMSYIKEVSELVKLIFNSSYYNKTTIEDEVQLLKSYINIEKRRSPFPFNDVIKYDPEIKQYFIPSLMTQIFAENAIHHGFSDFKVSGALLSICFQNTGPYIVCKIADNGMGITASKKLKKTASHKPRKHGVEIIQERLGLLNKNLKREKFKMMINEVKSKNDKQIIGTKVEIWFPKQGEKADKNLNKNK